MSNQTWRVHWYLAAVFNLFNGTVMLTDPQGFFALMGAAEYAPTELLWFHIVSFLVVLFGLGYYAVARNLDAHDDIVILGAFGKLGVWASATTPWLLGTSGTNIPWQLVVLVQADLIFSILFFWFLISRKSTRAAT